MRTRCSDQRVRNRDSSGGHRAPKRHARCSWVLTLSVPLAAVLAASAAGAADAVGAAPMAAAGQPHGLNSLYADPRQPDISGLWLITGAFNFAPNGALPELLGKYKTLYDQRMRAFNAGTPIDDVTANCLPAGLPHLDVVPYPFEIMQTPGRVTMLYEYDSVVRRIPIGGGPGDPGDDTPAYYGTSVGHWDGTTLVIETSNIRADTQVDYTGLPHSDALRMTERLRRLDATTLQNEITLTDPKAYAKPFTVTRVYKLRPKWHIEEYVCRENNRNETDAEGHTGTGVIEQH
jgi:hypothetical protein